MRESVVAIFAHPDDESFGPGGTLAHLAETHDVYLITVTDGSAGYSSVEHHESLAELRKKELIKASEILGLKEVFFLNFPDSKLSNHLYHKIADKIEDKLSTLNPEIVITFGPNGVSGHIDHITVAMITTHVIKKLPIPPQLWYYQIRMEEYEAIGKDYFIYFPEGIRKYEADRIVDVSNVWDKKTKALHAHASQKHDGDKVIKILNTMPKEEYFTVFKEKKKRHSS